MQWVWSIVQLIKGCTMAEVWCTGPYQWSLIVQILSISPTPGFLSPSNSHDMAGCDTAASFKQEIYSAFKSEFRVIPTAVAGSSLYPLHVIVIILFGFWIDVLTSWFMNRMHSQRKYSYKSLGLFDLQWVSINSVRQPAFEDIGGNFLNLSELLHSLMVPYIIDKSA